MNCSSKLILPHLPPQDVVDPGRVLQREQLLVVLCQVEEVVEGVLVEGGGGGVEDVAAAEAEGGRAAAAGGRNGGGSQLWKENRSYKAWIRNTYDNVNWERLARMRKKHKLTENKCAPDE